MPRPHSLHSFDPQYFPSAPSLTERSGGSLGSRSPRPRGPGTWTPRVPGGFPPDCAPTGLTETSHVDGSLQAVHAHTGTRARTVHTSQGHACMPVYAPTVILHLEKSSARLQRTRPATFPSLPAGRPRSHGRPRGPGWTPCGLSRAEPPGAAAPRDRVRQEEQWSLYSPAEGVTGGLGQRPSPLHPALQRGGWGGGLLEGAVTSEGAQRGCCVRGLGPDAEDKHAAGARASSRSPVRGSGGRAEEPRRGAGQEGGLCLETHSSATGQGPRVLECCSPETVMPSLARSPERRGSFSM